MQIKIYHKSLAHAVLLLLFMALNYPIKAQLSIGIFADCQYTDSEATTVRHYRNSLSKLDTCLTQFNQNKNIEFVVGLGDLIDKDFSSYEAVNKILAKSNHKIYHVTGNHDFSVEPELLDKVPGALGLKDTYYTFSKKGWQFIFLNGNKLSIHSNNSQTVEAANKMLNKLKAENAPNAHTWNGGLGTEQTKWLKKQLGKAERKNKKVVLFCHYPILPYEDHVFWEGKKILELLKNYDCVKAWINGHKHDGGYACENGIHFVTMQGMVDTEKENAYSVVTFSEKEILIEGFGREKSRKLEVKQ